MNLKQKVQKVAAHAKEASFALNSIDTKCKNKLLLAMAAQLRRNKRKIFAANKKDLVNARAKKLSTAFIDRLTLTEKRVNEMADSLIQVARLSDPVGKVMKSWTTRHGLRVRKTRVPLGVVLIIYESRPNVTADCIALCLKTSNCVILRGGSDALHSSRAIFSVLHSVARRHKFPQGCISLVNFGAHQAVNELLQLDEYIDVVIPRGGERLIREVKNKSTIPVIKHYKGVCHVYVDQRANLKMAQNIVFNAKVQRPGVCNAIETLLVHKKIAKKFLPSMITLLQEAGCQIRGCSRTRTIVKRKGAIRRATEADWYAEYLDLILALRVVDSLEDAIHHINHYGSRHSESIVTSNKKSAEKFLHDVDASCVFVNASTRFNDGYQMGLGAEIGISTDKLHARGPMALEELTTYKYVIRGKGQIRR